MKKETINLTPEQIEWIRRGEEIKEKRRFGIDKIKHAKLTRIIGVGTIFSLWEKKFRSWIQNDTDEELTDKLEWLYNRFNKDAKPVIKRDIDRLLKEEGRYNEYYHIK